MPLINTYYLSKFIALSLRDRASREDPDWTEWKRVLLRVYHNELPYGLLKSLEASEIEDLVGFAQSEISKNEENKKRAARIFEEARLSAIAKRDQWIRRRDAGNARVEAARQKRLQICKEVEDEKDRLVNERYIQDMLPTWTATVDEFTQKRELEMSTIWSK